jgi:UDP-N-acetylmuramoyl-tripeptide--D-alanyl-D-alanine ligase
MAELGTQTEQMHTELGTSIAQAKVDLLLAVGKLAKITADAAKSTAQHNLDTRESRFLKIKCFEDALSLCNKLHEFIKDYDIILVKGSRTARLETVVEKLKELFS